MTWCWWCCHDFDTPELKLPYKYDALRNIFQTCGIFCSWSCMKAYAIDKYGITRGGIICGNMVLMRKKMFNAIGHIQKAPNRYELIEFGGNMTIQDFRTNRVVDKREDKQEINEKPQPEILIPFVSNIKKMDEIKNNNTNNDSLRLKRNKPLQRSHNNLESALGLVIKS